MKILGAVVTAALAGVAGFALAWWAAVRSEYGIALFLGVPVLMGFLAVRLDSGKSGVSPWKLSLLPLLVGAFLLLAWHIEGIICLAMAAPLAIPLALFGGSTARKTRRASLAIALVPFTLFTGHSGPAKDDFKTSTSIIINAAPEKIWPLVTAFPKLPAPDELIFRAGVAAPIATAIHGEGPGSSRECILTTGTMHERVSVWNPPNLLRFEVLDTPPAMKELNPFGEVDAPHLHGFYVSRQGQFELTPLPGGKTLVTGTSWYRHGLEPAQYWRLWSDYVVHKVHRRVLAHIKTLAEAQR